MAGPGAAEPTGSPSGGAASAATTRFSDRVADYVRARPGYPRELIALLAEEAGLTPAWEIADIGCGPGHSALRFLENGNRVIGVEPNAEMREAASPLVRRYRSFRTVDGSAESTTLPPASVDCVVAAQAFHWFDRDAAAREFARILRPGGPVALLWNTRKLDGTAFLRAYERMLLAHATDYSAVRHDALDEGVFDRFFAPGHRTFRLYNEQRLDREGVRARLLSSSYTPGPDHPGRAPMLAELDRIFDDHAEDGLVCMVYDLEVRVGRPAG